MPEPAVLKHARDLYFILVERSQVLEDGQRVYAGKMSSAWAELGASNSFYTRVRNLLESEGCISVEHRGVRGAKSILILHKAPEKISRNPLTAAPMGATLRVRNREAERLEQRVSALEARTGGVNLTEALRNMESRLGKVEQELAVIRGNGSEPQERGKEV